jgi:glycosyltransferase involved in cell wall biosynthesis
LGNGETPPLPLRLLDLLRLAAAINRDKHDILHIHYAYLGVLGVFDTSPMVLHCHGTDLRWGLRDRLRSRFVVSALRRAQRVLVSTPDLLDHLQDLRPDAMFLPNPVDVDVFRPTQRPERSTVRVLIISEGTEMKGIEVATGAATQLQIRYPSVEIRAIARSERDVARFTALGIRSFVPAVPRALMPSLINDHDVVIGQFVVGSLGLNELESLACGKPVIARFRYPGAYPEAPPIMLAEEPGQVADALESLVSDAAARAEAGIRGRAWVERHHSPQVVARRLVELYEGMLTESDSNAVTMRS